MISELKERFQSHSMKSYRSRFQRMYDLYMSTNAAPFLGGEQLSQFPHLQQWLGLSAAGTVELGHIVESPVIQTATSIVPLGWRGIPGEKNVEPLKVDVTGYGLHLCSLVQAQVNGNWCSTVLESLPPMPSNYLNHGTPQDLQKIRVLIGPPLKRPLKHPVIDESFPNLPSPAAAAPPSIIGASDEHHTGGALVDGGVRSAHPLIDLVVYCTSDFVTICKEVHVRTRRVRLLGLEGSGKTALFNSIVGEGRLLEESLPSSPSGLHLQEAIAGGLCYLDSAGVNLQDLQSEAERFREELQAGEGDLRRRTDLVVLVHNLAHKIPRDRQPGSGSTAERRPALAAFLEEAEARGVPWVLAITNKFSVSAHQQGLLVGAAMEAYRARPDQTEITNSSPYIVPSTGGAAVGDPAEEGSAARRLAFVRMPFQKKAVMPIEGVPALRRLVHRVLLSREEAALEELMRERLAAELARQKASGGSEAGRELQESGSGGALTAAAVGASLGAGLGIVMAIVMGAGSALRKP